MRLSAPISERTTDPESWVQAVRKAGYRAANAPLEPDADDATVEAYRRAARDSDIVIAEVGAWSNPIDRDASKAREAIVKCQRHLLLAERLGARCCVNITGSRNPEKWDGPHPENFSGETFEMIVRTTREIVDAIKPGRTYYTLETMPWIFPSSPDEYLELIKAIDRPSVAVHLDPVNMINTPARAYRTGDFIRECFAKLGPLVKSCHAKDIIMRENFTVHLMKAGREQECSTMRSISASYRGLMPIRRCSSNTCPMKNTHWPRNIFAAWLPGTRSKSCNYI